MFICNLDNADSSTCRRYNYANVCLQMMTQVLRVLGLLCNDTSHAS